MKHLLIAAGGCLAFVGGVALTATPHVIPQAAQRPATAGADWTYPQGDAGGTRFSTLAQITTDNVTSLERAWTFKTGSGRFAMAPMAVNGIMYFSAPNGVYAIDGATGKQLWKFAPPPPTPPPAPAAATPTPTPTPTPQAAATPPAGRGGFDPSDPTGLGGRGGGRGGGGRGGEAGTALRGPTYWAGTSTVAPRIFTSTHLGTAALDARTGTLVRTFGEDGYILGVRSDSYPVFYRNVLITDGPNDGDKGKTVKGYDIVTGKPLWTFYTKAQPGDPNRSTWLNGSADTAASPDIWGMFTVDEERGIVFVPVEKTSGNGNNDYWGGPNHGANLYSDSLVALDALTGRMKWFHQLVHHDIWDYDIAAAPTLIEVRRNGQVIPAVAQQTKMALLFIFHRETGEPIFGMEERKVPQTTAPGEWTSPTQPFPVKPAPLARNSMTRADLAAVTPELKEFCADLWDRYKIPDAVPYDPWRVGQNIVVLPGAQGGGNWHGTSYHKTLGLIITNAMNFPQWGSLTTGGGRRGRGGAAAAPPAAPIPPTPPATGAPVNMSKATPEQGRFWMAEKQWSCVAPPWNELIAIDANTGDVAWRTPLGEFEELTKLGVPPTGVPSAGGAITTAGNLVFIGATVDGYFRAFDARSGKELWRDKLPRPSQGTPTTFMGADGKQYVVVGANGGGFFGAPTGDEVIAYRLK